MSLANARTYIRELAVPAGDALKLTKLAPFADIVVLSFAFFTSTHLVFAPLLSRILAPESFGKLGRRARNNWSVHVVSQAHALIIVPLAAHCLGVPTLDQDRAFGWHDEAGFLQAIACGYFLWDACESILNFTDFGFVLHALSCLAIYAMAFQPFLAYYGCRFLLWEVSTIFLNIHWWLDKTGHTGSKFQLVNGVLLLSTFFGVRIVYGSKMSYDFYHTLYDVRHEIPTAYVVLYGGGNIILNSLNWIWFFRMVGSIRKRFSKTTKPAHANGSANANGKAD